MNSLNYDDIYQTCYHPTVIKRSDSSGSVTEDSGSGRSLSDADEEICSYEERCGSELKIVLFERLEKRISKLLTVEGVVTRGLEGVLDRIVEDVLRLSEDEPYGVRGAALVLKMIDRTGKENFLGATRVDDSTVSTFKLILALKESNRISTSLRNLFTPLVGGKNVRTIASDYVLLKRQLYRLCEDDDHFI